MGTVVGDANVNGVIGFFVWRNLEMGEWHLTLRIVLYGEFTLSLLCFRSGEIRIWELRLTLCN